MSSSPVVLPDDDYAPPPEPTSVHAWLLWLTEADVPLGPVAQEQEFWQHADGKLHSSRKCVALRYAAPALVHARTRAIKDLTPEVACSRCPVLTSAAHAHCLVADAVVRVKQLTTRAIQGLPCTLEGSWNRLAHLAVATDLLAYRASLTADRDPELDRTARAATLAARAALTAGRELLGRSPALAEGDPFVLVLADYLPGVPGDWTLHRGELLAAATTYTYSPTTGTLYALLPSPPASDWLRSLPAEPTDGPAVLSAAGRLSELTSEGVGYSGYTARREKCALHGLHLARLIHA